MVILCFQWSPCLFISNSCKKDCLLVRLSTERSSKPLKAWGKFLTAGWAKVFVALSQQGSHGEQVWQVCPHLDRQRSLWTVDLSWIQRARRWTTSFYVVWNVCWTKTRTKKKWPGPRIGRAATTIVSVAGLAMRTMTSERNYNLFTDTDMGESDDKKPAFMQPWNVTSIN